MMSFQDKDVFHDKCKGDPVPPLQITAGKNHLYQNHCLSNDESQNSPFILDF